MKVITLNGKFLSQATRAASIPAAPDWTSLRHFAATFADDVAAEFVRQLNEHGTPATVGES